MRIEKLNQTTKKNLLEDLLKRSPNSYEMYEEQVKAILDNVKKRGDEALFEYTEKFDGFCLDQQSVLVKEEEIEEAYTQVDRGLIEIIRKALKNIETYHEKQRQYSWFDSKPDGTILGQKVTALDRVGVYVPGGKAAYPSSVLMNIVPAKTAGVREIIMVTPPGKDGKVTPTTLVAAKEAGAKVMPAHLESYYKPIDLPKGQKMKKAKVHEAILNCDVWINVPILKNHGGANLTISMKNHMGIVWDRGFFHQNDLQQCIADICTLEKKAVLNVVDAYRIMKTNGPRGRSESDVVLAKGLFISPDIVAVDTAAAKFFNQVREMPLDTVGHLAKGEALKIGTMNIDQLNVKRIKM